LNPFLTRDLGGALGATKKSKWCFNFLTVELKNQKGYDEKEFKEMKTCLKEFR
jgi:hypothetical protein